MHEIGIAAVILERVRLFTKEHNHSRVTRVGIRLGGLSGVDPDALTFGFEV
jgi:Zn finger protein HypA/HybF involved in hydrogenase expression